MKTAAQLTKAEILDYKKKMKDKADSFTFQDKKRKERAWKVAKKAARILKKEFETQKVVVFGSLITQQGFNKWSDIDIAVWGLADKDLFKAMGHVQDLDPEFEINLVDVNTCSQSLFDVINSEGVDV